MAGKWVTVRKHVCPGDPVVQAYNWKAMTSPTEAFRLIMMS